MKIVLDKITKMGIILCLMLSNYQYSIAQSEKDGYEVFVVKDEASEYLVKLERCIEINESHEYIEFFDRQDEDYILWLYSLNKANSMNNPEYVNPAKIIRNQSGNNTLIFTVYEKDGMRYDTLRNTLHPGEYSKAKNWDFLGLRSTWVKFRSDMHVYQQNLRGSLPKGVMTYISSKRKELEFGLLIVKHQSEVKIEMTYLTGEHLDLVYEGTLPEGWQKYNWSKSGLSRGVYTLKITVDGETMSQNFKY